MIASSPLSVVNDLESNSTIPYHLAQYCARLGQIDQAKQWLPKCEILPDWDAVLQRFAADHTEAMSKI